MEPRRIRIPDYAKDAARKGLQERKINKAGLTRRQADGLGIASGVERAKQIIRRLYVSAPVAKRIARFYLRFRNQRTPRAETAIRLWGGRRFGGELARIYYRK